MQKIVVAASSLPAGRNMSSQIEYLQRITNYGADIYHLDVMDGEFVKNKSIDYTYFEQLREKSTLLFDAHLMINSPDKFIDKYIKAGADIISVHYEAFDDVEKLINLLVKIKSKGKLAGIAIDLPTDIKVINNLIKYIDLVLIMSVKAGKGGQEFNKSAVKKIKYVRSLSNDVLIEVDGGIDDQTAPQCVRAGADILVSGNYIYNNDAYSAIQSLKGKNG